MSVSPYSCASFHDKCLLAPPCRVSPRALTAHFISRLVSVEGIVTKASLVRPKVVRTVQYCEATKQFNVSDFRDVTSHDGLPTGTGRCCSVACLGSAGVQDRAWAKQGPGQTTQDSLMRAAPKTVKPCPL